VNDSIYNAATKDVYLYAPSAGPKVGDTKGGDFYLNAGRGTGTGTPGDFVFKTSTALGSSNRTVQTLTSRWWIKGGTGTLSNEASPSSSAIVNVASTTQGVLIPRMTKTQRDAISSPATGLMVYQTDNTPGLRVWNGTNWMRYTETAD
jgi:hypothetical protein